MPFVDQVGFEVIVENDIAIYVDPDLMAGVTVILQNWTTNLTLDRFRGPPAAVTCGAGLVGCAWLENMDHRRRPEPGQWRARPTVPHRASDEAVPIDALFFHGRVRRRHAGTLRRYLSYCSPIGG